MIEDVFQKSAQDIPHRGVLRPRDFSEDFQFKHYIAPQGLEQYIDYIWIISWSFAPSVTRESLAILPNPQVNVFFSKEGAGIQDIFRNNRTYYATGEGCIAGVTFQPGGFHGFWPHDLSKLTDRVVVMREIFPQVDKRYASELVQFSPDDIHKKLELLLLSHPPMPDANIATIQQIITTIENDRTLTTTHAVATRFNKSERALQQLFQHYAGIGVKWVLLRKRVLDAAESTRQQALSDWLAVALNLGYSSQAHFITNFKRTIGMTPTEYLRFVN
jgi:AraC-like DNA-binding protein